jgi:hypothetical protein
VGHDISPKAAGPEHQAFIEHIELQPIDAQTNGPQLFYGLRYHIRIVKPGEIEAFHDQVGYWLWEPATGALVQSLSIPRGQMALAMGVTRRRMQSRFDLKPCADRRRTGFCRTPFTVHEEGSWSNEQETVLVIPGQQEPFLHTDRNTLRKVGEPTPNPTAQAASRASPDLGSTRMTGLT